jgi:hypothetical protein
MNSSLFSISAFFILLNADTFFHIDTLEHSGIICRKAQNYSLSMVIVDSLWKYFWSIFIGLVVKKPLQESRGFI